MQAWQTRMTYILSMLLIADRLGAAVFMGLTVTAATVTSLIMDHFGLMGFEMHKAGIDRMIGGALMVAGIALIAIFYAMLVPAAAKTVMRFALRADLGRGGSGIYPIPPWPHRIPDLGGDLMKRTGRDTDHGAAHQQAPDVREHAPWLDHWDSFARASATFICTIGSSPSETAMESEHCSARRWPLRWLVGQSGLSSSQLVVPHG